MTDLAFRPRRLGELEKARAMRAALLLAEGLTPADAMWRTMSDPVIGCRKWRGGTKPRPRRDRALEVRLVNLLRNAGHDLVADGVTKARAILASGAADAAQSIVRMAAGEVDPNTRAARVTLGASTVLLEGLGVIDRRNVNIASAGNGPPKSDEDAHAAACAEATRLLEGRDFTVEAGPAGELPDDDVPPAE